MRRLGLQSVLPWEEGLFPRPPTVRPQPLRELGALTLMDLAPSPGRLPLGAPPPPRESPSGPSCLTWSDSSKHRQRVVSESHARGAALRGEGTAEVQLS